MATIIVNNFIALKNAIVEGAYDTIILSEDIQMEVNGINIPSSTAELTIDGADPITGERHTILDYNSNSINDTIYINSNMTIARFVTIKNVILHIRNYYGFVGIYNSLNNQNVTLKYQNVDFSGVQAFYNRYGKCILEDSTFFIDRLYSSVNAINEVAEANCIELIGKIGIISNSSANSTFWFPTSNPSFTIMEEAIVTIQTSNRELIYSDFPVNFTIQKKAKLHADCNWGMFYGTGNHRANNIIISEDAEFFFQQRTANSSISTIRCDNFIANPNSQVVIRVNYSSSAPLVQITANGGGVTVNDPKRFVLYNYGNRVLYYSTGTGTFTANAEQFNFWQNAQVPAIAGSINNLPLRRWQKKDRTNVQLTANVANTSTTNLSSNILAPDDSDIPLNVANYPLHNTPVLSYGRMQVDIETINDSTVLIKGNTEKEATIQMTTSIDSYIMIADSEGFFSQILVKPLAKNSEINFLGAKTFLYFTYFAITDGSLHFLDVPEYLRFRDSGIPTNKHYLLRKNSDWAILIEDTRTDGSPWTLYAIVFEPLHTDTAAIENGLIFVDQQEYILNSDATTIYKGEGNKVDETITTISWDELEGILIGVIPDYNYQKGLYMANINWILKPDENTLT